MKKPAALGILDNDRRDGGLVIPIALHRHEMGTDDAFKFSKAFENYMAKIGLPIAILEEWRDWREWWNNEYIIARLEARFGKATIRSAIAQATYATKRMPSAKQKRDLRVVRRAVRMHGGLNSWEDRPTIGRKHFQFAE